MLHFLDWFFLLFHSSLVLFNLFGWIWRKTRVLNLAILILTGFSWFGLGIFYGIGYCPLTDWHWQVLHRLGHNQLPESYMQYLMERLTGVSVNSNLVDYSTLGFFLLALFLSLVCNLRDYKQRTRLQGKQNN